MGHNIHFDKKRKQYSFVTAKEIAWHGLGTVVKDRMTSRECIEEANLDYNVEKGKVFVRYNKDVDGKKGMSLPGKSITYRTDTGIPFDVVSDRYEIVQNREAFDFFDQIVGEKRAIYETAGALGKGETIFMSAKLPEHILIGGIDKIDQYLILTMSHDGTGSIIAKFTPIRVVCNNTLSAALSRGTNLFKIRHTSGARERLSEAQKLLQITYKTSKATQELYEQLTKIKITDELRDEFFLRTMLTKEEMEKLAITGVKWYASDSISTRKKNTLQELFKYHEVGPGQDLDICKGTAYGAYNSIAGFIQNVKSFGDKEKKFSSIINGADNNVLQQSLNLITNLT